MPKWDEDGSWAQARAEARAEQRAARESDYERPARERESTLGLRERPDPPDLLGIRLNDDQPSLSEQYGVTLIDREQSERLETLKDEVDAMAERWSRREWDVERPERTPEAQTNRNPLSCTVNPILGLGPSVDLGNGKFGVDLPGSWPKSWNEMKVGLSVDPSASIGKGPSGGYELSYGLDVRYGLPLNLANGFAGASYNDTQGTLEFGAGGTLLGVTCRIGVETSDVTRQFDKTAEDAAHGMAPYLLDALHRLGLPAVP